MRRKSHVGCGAGEKMEITSKSYLLLLKRQQDNKKDKLVLILFAISSL